MAEELDPKAGTETIDLPADDPNAAPPADDPNAAVPGEDDAPNPVEVLASEMGWAPKDKFRGDEADWKPADQFIKAGKDIQRNLARDLKELKTTQANMARTQASIVEQQLAERDAYWQGKRREAFEAGDYQALEHADQQRQQIRQQAPQVNAPTSEGNDFIERNSAWYGKDQEATSYAVGRADHYARQGLSAARQLAAVEQDMRSVFPDLFSAARTPAKPAPAVAPPASRNATAMSRKKGFHDLPADAQAVARDMADRGVIPNTDIYVTNYFNQPERKVG